MIRELQIEEFNKCDNIWDMEKQSNLADIFYMELLDGNRKTFVMEEDEKFIAEGSIVFKNDDPDYTIEGKRAYFSRLLVKKEYRNLGIGGTMIDYIVDYAEKLGYQEISIGVDSDNGSALHLYNKKGFTTLIEKAVDEKGEYLKLLKKLSPNLTKSIVVK